MAIAQLHLSVYKPYTAHNFAIRFDEGLTLETSTFESLYGGQFTSSTQPIKAYYSLKTTTFSISAIFLPYFAFHRLAGTGFGPLMEIHKRLEKG